MNDNSRRIVSRRTFWCLCLAAGLLFLGAVFLLSRHADMQDCERRMTELIDFVKEQSSSYVQYNETAVAKALVRETTNVQELEGVTLDCGEDELRQFFQAAHRVLREGGGLFLDLSTPYKLRRVLGNHFIGDEDENIAYLWQNRYHEQQNCVEMNLAIFVRQEGETYLRIGEQQRQYAHTAETLGTLLHECGFTDVAVFGDKHMEAPGEKECRWFVAARKPLGGAEV